MFLIRATLALDRHDVSPSPEPVVSEIRAGAIMEVVVAAPVNSVPQTDLQNDCRAPVF